MIQPFSTIVGTFIGVSFCILWHNSIKDIIDYFYDRINKKINEEFIIMFGVIIIMFSMISGIWLKMYNDGIIDISFDKYSTLIGFIIGSIILPTLYFYNINDIIMNSYEYILKYIDINKDEIIHYIIIMILIIMSHCGTLYLLSKI